MTTYIRKGNCKVAEFNAFYLSQAQREASAFIAMLEGRGHGKYLVTHIEHLYDNLAETDSWEVSIFYDYFLDKWEELDLNRETELVDMADALTPEGSIE